MQGAVVSSAVAAAAVGAALGGWLSDAAGGRICRPQGTFYQIGRATWTLLPARASRSARTSLAHDTAACDISTTLIIDRCWTCAGRKQALLVGDALFAAGALLMGLATGISTLITGQAWRRQRSSASHACSAARQEDPSAPGCPAGHGHAVKSCSISVAPLRLECGQIPQSWLCTPAPTCVVRRAI